MVRSAAEWFIWAFLILFLASCGLVRPTFETGPRTTIEGSIDGRQAAVQACHRFVGDLLEPAESASFPERDDHQIDARTNGIYHVKSFYWSSYPEGIRIKKTYTCDVKQLGEGTWARGPLYIQRRRYRVTGWGGSPPS